jgi:glycosyltransferase involved in cell wall biosynthesis
MSSPLISIIIPCFRQGRFLAQAIESVLGQTYGQVETIVVNDGSPDDTAAVASRYLDRIKYLEQANAGVCAARNEGVAHATGDFLLFLDADDYLAPDMLSRMVERLQAQSESDVVYGDCLHVDTEGRELSFSKAVPLPEDAFHALLERNLAPMHCVLMRRTLAIRAGLFDGSYGGFWEDRDLYLRLAWEGARFAMAEGAVAMYRLYPASRSNNLRLMVRGGRAVITKNASRHHDCERCRRGMRIGLQGVRDYCYLVLSRQLFGPIAVGGIAWRIWRAASSLRYEPRLFPRLFHEFAWRSRDSLLRRHGAAPR